MKGKKNILLLLCILCVFIFGCKTAHAYSADDFTEEEKQMAKDWLEEHGYPPTRAGAEEAYADYLNGKFDEELGIYSGNDEEADEVLDGNEQVDKSQEEDAVDDSVNDTMEMLMKMMGEEAETSEASEQDSTSQKQEEITESEKNNENEETKIQQERKKRYWMGIVLIIVSTLLITVVGYFLFFKKEEK